MRNTLRRIVWFAPAFKGLPLRERTRLLRLARSGRAVEDPDDARVVCAFVRQQLAPLTPSEWVEEFVLPVVLVPFAVLVATPYFGWDYALFAVALAGFLTWWVRRRFRATLKATDCPDL